MRKWTFSKSLCCQGQLKEASRKASSVHSSTADNPTRLKMMCSQSKMLSSRFFTNKGRSQAFTDQFKVARLCNFQIFMRKIKIYSTIKLRPREARMIRSPLMVLASSNKPRLSIKFQSQRFFNSHSGSQIPLCLL